MVFVLIKTEINGKEKETKTIGAYDDIMIAITDMSNDALTVMTEDMDKKKYAYYVVEPVTFTIIRKMIIEG